jgi:hypothetical protein
MGRLITCFAEIDAVIDFSLSRRSNIVASDVALAVVSDHN